MKKKVIFVMLLASVFYQLCAEGQTEQINEALDASEPDWELIEKAAENGVDLLKVRPLYKANNNMGDAVWGSFIDYFIRKHPLFTYIDGQLSIDENNFKNFNKLISYIEESDYVGAGFEQDKFQTPLQRYFTFPDSGVYNIIKEKEDAVSIWWKTQKEYESFYRILVGQLLYFFNIKVANNSIDLLFACRPIKDEIYTFWDQFNVDRNSFHVQVMIAVFEGLDDKSFEELLRYEITKDNELIFSNLISRYILEQLRSDNDISDLALNYIERWTKRHPNEPFFQIIEWNQYKNKDDKRFLISTVAGVALRYHRLSQLENILSFNINHTVPSKIPATDHSISNMIENEIIEIVNLETGDYQYKLKPYLFVPFLHDLNLYYSFRDSKLNNSQFGIPRFEQYNDEELISYLDLMISHNIDIHQKPSLLMDAVGMNSLKLVEYLISKGFDPRFKIKGGLYSAGLTSKLPVDYARELGHSDIVAFLDPITYGGGAQIVKVERIIENESSDKNPPRIRLDNLDSLRGLKIASSDQEYDAITSFQSIDISGFVVDEGVIKKVLVNNKKAVFNNLGEFSYTLSLDLGINTIVVEAIDNSNNIATKSVVVFREKAKTLEDELGIVGKSYALLIGNELYSYLPELQTPIEDSHKIGQILSEKYGFEIEIIENASRENIIRSLSKYAQILGPEDNFLLYYAGHGYFDELSDLSYWLPVDAERNNDNNWILSNRVIGYLKRISSKHIALISDSCFSGTLSRDGQVSLDASYISSMEYVRKMISKTSRTILSSGGNEPVADGGGGGHSIFAKYLIRSLEDMEEEVFTLEDLFFKGIKIQVAGNAQQTPEYKIIHNAGHEGGDFVFIRQ